MTNDLRQQLAVYYLKGHWEWNKQSLTENINHFHRDDLLFFAQLEIKF